MWILVFGYTQEMDLRDSVVCSSEIDAFENEMESQITVLMTLIKSGGTKCYIALGL